MSGKLERRGRAAPFPMIDTMREQMLELSEEESVTPELLDSQVQKAQEQLLVRRSWIVAGPR